MRACLRGGVVRDQTARAGRQASECSWRWIGYSWRGGTRVPCRGVAGASTTCPLVEPRAAASTHTQIKRTWNEKSRWWLVSWVAAVGSGRGPGPEAAVELSQDRGARQRPWQLACGDIYL